MQADLVKDNGARYFVEHLAGNEAAPWAASRAQVSCVVCEASRQQEASAIGQRSCHHRNCSDTSPVMSSPTGCSTVFKYRQKCR